MLPRVRSLPAFLRLIVDLLIGLVLALAATTERAQGQTAPTPPIAGRNVNMVAGTMWPGGDPFLQRQNEPSIAASTRNPLHLLAGANDYRTVDLPGLPDSVETGDAWLGLFKSFDGGQRWRSTLVHGYPQDTSPEGTASPVKGYQAAADPVVRAGAGGLFFYSGLAFDRASGKKTGRSAIFVARLVDNNNKEAGDPIAYLGTSVVTSRPANAAGQFLDKPWMAVDLPRGTATCRIVTPSTDPNDAPVTQTVPAGAVYVAYTALAGEWPKLTSEIYLSRSLDCGVTWSSPVRLSRKEDQINQGATIAIDPANGNVYVAWRRFSTSMSTEDAIMFARSIDRGRKFDPPGVARRFPRGLKVGLSPEWIFEHRRVGAASEVAELSPFDQSTASDRFRTNGYPTLAVDGNGRVYMAWSERGFGMSQPDPINGDARVLIATWMNGLGWTGPQPIDEPEAPGHQLMPTLAFAGGRLTLAYYDLREDVSHTWGKYVEEGNVSPPKLRHTFDLRVAHAAPGETPHLSESARVSDYLVGSRPGGLPSAPWWAVLVPCGPDKPDQTCEQMQFNPPNLPIFKQGTAPFVGDYVDLAPAPVFVPTAGGGWAYNTSGASTLFHVSWTDNRDVRPPRFDTNGDGNPWNDYTPPTYAPGTSPFDPSRNVPSCVSGNAGSRNQNIYTARITGGLVVGSPGNSKTLSATLQRGFVVFAHNTTDQVRVFRLKILGQPAGGRASFSQFPLPTDPPPLPAPVEALDVEVAPKSMVSRTVYVTSSNPHARVEVSVVQIAAVGGDPVPDGLGGVVVLNPDIENPDIENPDIENPDIENPDIENAEVYNPDIENPDIENPDIENPDIENPDIENPDIENINVANPDIENPDIENPDIENPDIENPDIENPDIENPDIENSVLTDVSWTTTNKGNTTAAYNVNLLLKQATVPQGFKLQLILHRLYRTPVAAGCDLKVQTQNVLVASLPNPELIPVGSPLPDPDRPDLDNATIWLPPGDSARITLRIYDPDRSNNLIVDGKSIDPAFYPGDAVTPLIAAEAVNSDDAAEGRTEPPFATPSGSAIFFLHQPTTTPFGGPIAPPVIVQVWDKAGAGLPDVVVTLSLETNPTGATLSGDSALTDDDGRATFPNLQIDTPGTGYRLAASVGIEGVDPAISLPFDVPLLLPTIRVSVASDGAQATGGTWGSWDPVMSADARYVAFYSEATSLVAGDTNDAWDVFVRDRQTGQTTRVSVATDGTQASGDSTWPALSADGRYVAFQSDATNLVAGDTNGEYDVFVRDLQTGQTTRVSVATDGTQANGGNWGAKLSADGRYVAFYSEATNLVAGDTNAASDVFVRDLQTGQTTRVSVATDGTQANDDSASEALSADGRYVAFTSDATNLVAGDTNAASDVFLRDLQTGQTARVSVATGGTQANDQSAYAALSADGRYVAFASVATNLIPGDTNAVADVFIRDRLLGQTTRVSVASDGTQANSPTYSVSPSLSGDGRYVTFYSDATNLVAGDTNGAFDVFVHNRVTGQTRRVSLASDGTEGNGDSGRHSLSADGRYVAFSSLATNLVPGDTNNFGDAFLVQIAASGPVIDGVIPSTVADGLGQLLTILGRDLPWSAATRMVFTQGATTADGSVFQILGSPTEAWARLPVDESDQPILSPGPASVVLIDGATQTESVPITVSSTPGTPQIRLLVSLIPSEGGGCDWETPVPAAPGRVVVPNVGLLVSAYGIDTWDSSVVFTQDGTEYVVPASCWISGGGLGLGAVVVVPAELEGGSATVQIRTRVNGVWSALSPAVPVLVVPLIIENPDLDNPDIDNPEIQNPDIQNPEVGVGADLVVESLTHQPADPTTSDLMTFIAVVKNVGTAPAAASTLLFKIGGETPGAPQTLYSVPALAPGATFTVHRQLTLDVAQGYVNTATADYNGDIGESNEGNNTTTDSFVVTGGAPVPIL